MTSFAKRLGSVPPPAIFLASILVAIGILWQQEALNDIRPVLADADPAQIILALALYGIGLALLCLRWDAIVRMVRGSSSFLRASEAFLTSVAINYAAPISLAIPSRALLTRQALDLSTSQTGAVAFWEVAVDVIVLAAGSLLWIAVTGWDPGEVDFTGSELVLVLVGLAVLAAVVAAALYVISRMRPSLIPALRQTASESLTYPLRHPVSFLFVMLLTLAFWLIQGAVLTVLYDAVSDADPTPSLILGLTTVPMLLGMVSPLPGGAGVREAAMVAIAGVHDVSSAEIVIVAVVYRLALFAMIPVLYLLVRVARMLLPQPPASLDAELQPGSHSVADAVHQPGGHQ